MRSVQPGPVIGLAAELALLAALAATVGLGSPGWIVGVACGVVTFVALVRGLARSGAGALGPADRVTLLRATLVGGVAALVADSFRRPAPLATLVTLTVVALVLDAVDGWIARRTGTESRFGARFDMEVDAFLILVLSVFVARSVGWWVLAIGAARYVFVVAGWLRPWMREALPPRYWRKVVAAVAGIVLAGAAADVLPRFWTIIALLAVLGLLAESFGRDVAWLRRRSIESRDVDAPVGKVRTVAAWVTTALAGLLVWFGLVAPSDFSILTPAAFIRIPIEGLVLVGVVLVLPIRPRRIVAAVAGLVLGLLTIVKILDMGFNTTLGRPFNPVVDWGYFHSAVGLLTLSIGPTDAIASLVVAIALGVAVVIFMPLSVLRLTRLVGRYRTASFRTATALGVVWILCAVFGAAIVPGAPVASTSAAGLAYEQVNQVRDGIQDQKAFAKAAAVDPFRNVPGDQLLTGLRGKDVIVVFVESYGQVAVQGTTFSPQVDAVLDAGTSQLRTAGFSMRSAFLTSSTFGGISWLAHSTLQSGLWIDNQQRYDDLVAGDRFTLSDAFKRAGWRTVGDDPSNGVSWPVGTSFYHYDQVYNAFNVGYTGPNFSYASMPDQYTLTAFRNLELSDPNHAPVMAQIDLVSSHTPWAPLPKMVDPSELGDGSIFDGMPAQGRSPTDVWRDASQVRTAYAQSIEYSLNSVFSFVQTSNDKNLVLIVLGDHQPATIVSGQGANHEVPITIIAHDPAVLAQISSWDWQDGMRPSPSAPVWKMDAFRDRFLTAFGPQPPTH